jgi:hypothetical protein
MKEVDNQKNIYLIHFIQLYCDYTCNANNGSGIDMPLGILATTGNEGSPGPYCDTGVEFVFSDPLRQIEWMALLELHRLCEKIYEDDEISINALKSLFNNQQIDLYENKQN